MRNINAKQEVKLSQREEIGPMRERVGDTIVSPKDMDKHFDYADEASIVDKRNILQKKLKMVAERQQHELKQNRLLNSKIHKLRRQFLEDQDQANKEQEKIDHLANKIVTLKAAEIESQRRTLDVRNMTLKYESKIGDD